jgi:hypothetical protein
MTVDDTIRELWRGEVAEPERAEEAAEPDAAVDVDSVIRQVWKEQK